MTNTQHPLDESQLRVVQAGRGRHLVLAPPGCGKTHVLTERIRYAHARGVDFSQMLCLTFTNRAAREMFTRVGARISDEGVEQLFVGNIHRFCARFLINEGHVAADTSIIDDAEAVSIISDYMFEDPENVLGDFRRYQKYQEVIFFSHLMQQIVHGHDDALFLHPEVWTAEDRVAMKRICQLQRLEYNREAMIEVYHHADNYKNDGFAPGIGREMGQAIIHLALKMYYAHQYDRYKKEHHLLDFEDLLLQTYDLLRNDASQQRYPWIQVDEVQDLNAMQLAIIDQLTAPDASVVYLGDEQQAIFSFMGAKVETLTKLQLNCRGNIHHLNKNHRSPGYLLEVFNRYAADVLHIDQALLPTTDSHEPAPKDALSIVYSPTDEVEIHDIVSLASRFLHQSDSDTTAIIVGTNREADNLSEAMAAKGLPHFKVSGRDMFTTRDMKLLLAHLTVMHHEHDFVAWKQLLRGFGVFKSDALARRFLNKLRQLSIAPTDLLDHSDGDTYTQAFTRCYEQGEMVVFDTETTGLDTLTDDIIEISAMRIRGGQVVGQPLDLYLQTEKPIPAMLGDKTNPMAQIHREKKAAGLLLTAQEALERFLEFVGQRPVLGHNVQYDWNILDANLQRYCNRRMADTGVACFDSLKLIRLLQPGLPSYRLESLLEQLHLEGQNSHQAIDDVDATVHLVRYCHDKAKSLGTAQRSFLLHPKVTPLTQMLRDRYADYYRHTRSHLYQPAVAGSAIAEQLAWAYEEWRKGGYINEIKKLRYVLDHLNIKTNDDGYDQRSLADQLGAYLMTLGTMKEADFCNTASVSERIYITTVHKAKGLEFSNVIVHDVMAGRYPGNRNRTARQDAEDARRLYVAMSRAQKRLVLTCGMQRIDRYGRATNRELSPFLNCILSHFNRLQSLPN